MVRNFNRLLLFHGRWHLQRYHYASYAVPSWTQQRLHAAEPNEGRGERRPRILGHGSYVSCRAKVSKPASRLTAVAGPCTSCLQFAGLAMGYHFLQRRPEMANLHVQQWLQLQEHNLQRLFLQYCCPAGDVHWQLELCGLGRKDLGLGLRCRSGKSDISILRWNG